MRPVSIITALVIALGLCGMTACYKNEQQGAAATAPAQKEGEGSSLSAIKKSINNGPGDSSSSSTSSSKSSDGPTRSAYSDAGSSAGGSVYDSGDYASGSTSGSVISGNCNSGDAESDQWCERLRLARMDYQPRHVAVGEIPADPNVSRAFSNPIIFEDTQLYIWLSSTTYSIQGYGSGYRNRQVFYFLPTGRFYYKSVTYYGQTTPQGNVGQAWGRYRFTSEDGDEIELESDQGEHFLLPIKYGRRNLVWDETTFGQIDWENEALRREIGQ
jgi:hypothetical protein